MKSMSRRQKGPGDETREWRRLRLCRTVGTATDSVAISCATVVVGAATVRSGRGNWRFLDGRKTIFNFN